MLRVEHVMGMPIRIDVRDPGVPESAVDEAFAWFRHVDSTFSTYKDDSEIMRLNRGELALDDASADVRAILAECERLRGETGGYFDAAAGRIVDPSGLVKGWSVDRAGEILEAAGATTFSIYAGGDILTRGYPDPARVWRVGIQHPFARNRVAAVVPSNDLAVATSGEYERGAHVLDPHTGAPPEGVLSVTIVGPGLGSADAYATAAFAMGLAGPEWTTTLGNGFEALTILANGSVVSTRGFPRYRTSSDG
jgi:thiamine biosynthesis lipoprotein